MRLCYRFRIYEVEMEVLISEQILPTLLLYYKNNAALRNALFVIAKMTVKLIVKKMEVFTSNLALASIEIEFKNGSPFWILVVCDCVTSRDLCFTPSSEFRGEELEIRIYSSECVLVRESATRF